jgi:CelD/BcsL family acetyltransferase involved in cellulose biosynthesis
MSISTLNPLNDTRWTRFVDRHPRASIFHTRDWLEALRRTYGYEPIVYTTASTGQELDNGLVFCKVNSWLTGRRLVSLPFSDHCEPLVDIREEWEVLIAFVREEMDREEYKYLEIRPLTGVPELGIEAEMTLGTSFYLHTVDLRLELEERLRTFHKSCVQRKIRRAEREGISCVQGRSPELVRYFYQLLMATRRRHRLPPQPLEWFENLVDCLGEMLTIRVALMGQLPIASILTLSFKDRVTYKYCCSNERFHNLGGMQLLLWRTIQEGRERGAQVLDLGRTAMDHVGLADYKDHWGSTRSLLTYFRYPPVNRRHTVRKWTGGVARYAFARLPDPFLTAAGRFLYPHLG